MATKQLSRPIDLAGVVRLENGVRVVCATGEARPGDPIEAHIGDHLVGVAPLRRDRGHGLSAHIEIAPPLLSFPAELRVMNARSLREIGAGCVIANAEALLRAAGPPRVAATFAGLRMRGPEFSLSVDRLHAYGRPFALRIDGVVIGQANSTPSGDGGSQSVGFDLEQCPPVGTEITLVECLFGAVVLSARIDGTLGQWGIAVQLERLEREVATLREENAQLRHRQGTGDNLARDRLLLDRLDLFYLLIRERLAATPVRDDYPAQSVLPRSRRIGPAEIDGIGIFDVETDGHAQWRWFGPEATIALHGLAGPVCRVALLFLRFADQGETPDVRVSTGGPAEVARWRVTESRHALDVAVPPSAMVGGDLLVLRLSFDRHQRGIGDVRPLSAAFACADVSFGPS